MINNRFNVVYHLLGLVKKIKRIDMIQNGEFIKYKGNCDVIRTGKGFSWKEHHNEPETASKFRQIIAELEELLVNCG